MSTHVAPVALPAPEFGADRRGGQYAADVGPVLPLSGGGEHNSDLLGAGDHPSQTTSDPIAAKVLSRGDVLAVPTGRADDFSWPRPSAGASSTPDIAPQPTALNPAAPTKKTDKAKSAAEWAGINKNKPGETSGVSQDAPLDQR